MEQKKVRLLRADEIECRVGQATAKGFSLLLYKDARVDYDILDETFGAMNWQNEYKEIKGNLYCGTSVWDAEKQQWITKWNCGVESNTEKEKGEASDASKRSNVLWNIGRELYSSPFIWINGNVEDKNGKYVAALKNMRVDYISYDANRNIEGLIICNGDEIIFKWGKIKDYKASKTAEKPKAEQVVKQDAKPAETKQEPASTQKEVEVEINKATEQPKKKEKYTYELTLQEAENTTTPRGARLGDLTYEQLKVIMNNDKYDLHIRACAAKIIKELEDSSFVEETDTGNLDF